MYPDRIDNRLGVPANHRVCNASDSDRRAFPTPGYDSNNWFTVIFSHLDFIFDPFAVIDVHT